MFVFITKHHKLTICSCTNRLIALQVRSLTGMAKIQRSATAFLSEASSFRGESVFCPFGLLTECSSLNLYRGPCFLAGCTWGLFLAPQGGHGPPCISRWWAWAHLGNLGSSLYCKVGWLAALIVAATWTHCGCNLNSLQPSGVTHPQVLGMRGSSWSEWGQGRRTALPTTISLLE